MKPDSRTTAHRAANRFIGALLLLYPHAFREEFGAAVRDLVERDVASAAARGPWPLARAIGSHAWDIGVSALGQRLAPLTGARRGTMRNGGDGVVTAWSAWLRDAKYGARLLAKQRTFSLIVVLTLALAIGANTVIFTFTDVLILRPLPLRDPATLGWVFNIGPQGDNRALSSLADFYDFQTSSRSFTAMGARRSSTVTMSGRGDAERLEATQVTANLFDIWGLDRMAGRLFERGDDAAGAAPVVVLSHQFWQRRFAGDRAIVGQSLMLDGVSHTVIGVLDPAIEIGSFVTIDVWTPLTLDPSGGARDDRRLSILGRLAPGVSAEQASAELHAIATRLQHDHPQTNNGWNAHVYATRKAITGGNAWIILSLFVLVVAFVLLIACANLANLMLARSADRSREIAIRTALGANRRAIVRQLIIESLLLGAVGGGAGLVLAKASLVAIRSVAYDEFFKMLTIDRNVLVFVTAITLLTTVAFSLIPALQLSRTDVSELLKAGSGKASGDARLRRGRAALVVSQVALALSLTIVAVLVVRTLIETARIDPGFDPHNAFTLRVDLPTTRYADGSRLPLVYEKMLTELRSLPGVSSAALTSRLPVIGAEAPGPVSIEGVPVSRPADQPWASTSAVSADFFEATRIVVLGGRAFSTGDNAVAPRVAIVNREMAKRYWGSPAAALGKRVGAGGSTLSVLMTVVGVVADTRPPDITLPPSPQLYVPIAQQPERSIAVFLRSARASTLLPDVRAAIRRVDDGLALYQAQTVDEAFAIQRSSDYVLMGMYFAFAAIALSLAAAGLYGVISYSVSQRTRELGIRVALGATAGEVRSLVLAQGARLFIGGTVLGVAGAAMIATAIRSLLYRVSPFDPGTYVLVVCAMAAVMGVATYVPARRAVRVDPIKALRAE